MKGLVMAVCSGTSKVPDIQLGASAAQAARKHAYPWCMQATVPMRGGSRIRHAGRVRQATTPSPSGDHAESVKRPRRTKLSVCRCVAQPRASIACTLGRRRWGGRSWPLSVAAARQDRLHARPELRDVDVIDRDDRRALDPHEQARIEPSLEIAHRLAGDGAPLARTAHRIVIVVPSSGSKLAP